VSRINKAWERVIELLQKFGWDGLSIAGGALIVAGVWCWVNGAAAMILAGVALFVVGYVQERRRRQ